MIDILTRGNCDDDMSDSGRERNKVHSVRFSSSRAGSGDDSQTTVRSSPDFGDIDVN